MKQEENTFVIGDDEGDEEEEVTKPAMNEEATREAMVGSEQPLGSHGVSEQAPPPPGPATNPKYWIQKGDNLKGIALRLGVNAWALCQLNSLPPSTPTTTPHLLHTRRFLLLPPGTHIPEALDAETEQREELRRKERAMKRFQSVTKVVDCGIARAYMELAQDELTTPRDDWMSEKSEKGTGGRWSRSEEGAAVEAYLDDDEWEREQMRVGAIPRVRPWPFYQKAEGRDMNDPR